MKLGIIGGGPGGYSAAIRAGQLGAEVAVYESKDPGGVCLNRGCIPTKHLLSFAKIYRKAHDFSFVRAGDFTGKAVEHAQEGAAFFKKSLEDIFKHYDIELIPERAELVEPHVISTEKRKDRYDAVIIATGSKPFLPPTFNLPDILTGEDFSKIPTGIESVAIIGAGVEGIEYASFFALLGKEVTVIELKDNILPFLPEKISRRYEARLKKRGIKFFKGVKVEKVAKVGEKEYEVKTGNANFNVELVMVTAGRIPNSAGIKLKGIVDENNFIRVNDYFETPVSSHYAAGDVINTPGLAYVAYQEGEAAAENAVGGSRRKIDYFNLPYVVFGEPEIAVVGKLEGKEIRVQSGISGKSRAYLSHDGFLTLFVDNGEITGAAAVGEGASELIHILEILVTEGDFSFNPHFVHPSFSELIGEAYALFKDRPRHITRRKNV